MKKPSKEVLEGMIFEKAPSPCCQKPMALEKRKLNNKPYWVWGCKCGEGWLSTKLSEYNMNNQGITFTS